MPNPLKTKYVECACSSAEHTIRLVLDKEEHEIYLEVFLANHDSFIKRGITAIKYLFGYKCRYGHFEGALLTQPQIRELINTFIEFDSK
jgi:hypothetical protein